MTAQFTELYQALTDAGFTHRQGGVFSKKEGKDIYFWVSIDDQSSNEKLAIGCVFTRLLKKIYELTSKTSMPARPSFPISWGPPAFLMDFYLPESFSDPQGAINKLEGILRRFTDLDTVIDCLIKGEELFSWNRDHVVAAGLALLGKCEELQEFCSRSAEVGPIREFMEAALDNCEVQKIS